MDPAPVQIAAFLAALALFDPRVSSERPDDVVGDDDPPEGLICYWGCMAACVLVGQRQDHCDAVCTEMCFTITTGPTCEPEPEPVCG